MKEKDIHRLIEMQDLQKKQALKAKLDARLAAFPAPAPCADAPKKRRSVFTWVTACVCAVCLAIALPFLLTDGKTDDNSDHETLGNVFDRKTERHETFPNGETDFDVRSKTLGVPNGFPDKTFVRKNRCDDKTFRQAERQK